MKTVFITGATSGFGRITAGKLLEQDYRVIVGIRGGEGRLKTVFPGEMVATGRLHAIDLHLDRPETLSSCLEQLRRITDQPVEILINNAGYGLFGPLELQEPEQLRLQMEVNFLGAAELSRLLLPDLRKTRGRIINISSIAGRVGFPFYAAYCATKFALEGLTEALYYELRPFGVQVCLVEPGGFKTNFVESAHFTAVSDPELAHNYEVRVDRLKHSIVEKLETFGGSPERVARLLARLCRKRRLRLRYPIGRDARLVLTLKRLLPFESFYRLIYRTYEIFVFRRGNPGNER